MRSAVRFPTAAVLLATVAGCHLDKLVDPPPTGVLVVTPATVEAAAAAGSSAPHDLLLAVHSVHASATTWTVTRTGAGPWLTLHDSAGTTPDSVHLTLDPAGLPAGSYRDTLILTPDDPGAGPTRVPVTLTLGDCAAAATTIGSVITDSLRASDCASAHHPGRPARRYRFTGNAGDSVSFRLTSSALAVDLVVDTAATGDAPPFAESVGCGPLGGACLRYLRLPLTASYTVEVTTDGAGATVGPFTLALTSPEPPSIADPLGQLRADSVTPVAVGGTLPAPEMVVRGTPRDPDIADTLRLEVELQPLGTDFAGVATAVSAPTPSGEVAFVQLTGLGDGTSYHWRSRVVDQTGRATTWRSFGDNLESAADLQVVIAADRLQFRQPPTTTAAGAAITPAVEVAAVDRDGTLVTSFNGSITLALGGGPAGATLSGTRTASAVNGVATFAGLSLDRASTGYTLSAGSPGMLAATSPAFAIIPGPAARLTFTQQPTSTSAGSTITPAVEVTAFDGYGNVATSFTGAVTIALGQDGSLLQNAQLSGTRTLNAAAGMVRFADLSIDQVGTGYTLVATTAGPAAVTSAGFDILLFSGAPRRQR